jgi:hypothetical protein
MQKHRRGYHFPAHKPAKGCRGKAATVLLVILGIVLGFVVFALSILPASGATRIKIQCHSHNEVVVCHKHAR